MKKIATTLTALLLAAGMGACSSEPTPGYKALEANWEFSTVSEERKQICSLYGEAPNFVIDTLMSESEQSPDTADITEDDIKKFLGDKC